MRIAKEAALAAPALAMTSTSGEKSAADLAVIKHTLPNGLRLLLLERHDSPTVATLLRFNVGGVDDPKGQTGIAHLLEHMMFKGTKTFGTLDHEAEVPLLDRLDQLYSDLDQELAKRRSPFEKPDEEAIESLRGEIEAVTAEHKKLIVKDELWQTYQRLGGEMLNASTGDDATQYYVVLPANQLEVWACLEADRIANPVFREFYSERDVVHEERRLRTDTQPHSAFREAFQATAYTAHPYRNPVIGWPADIDSTVRAEVLRFFKTYYAPNNAIAVLVGDLDPGRALAIVEKYFGKVPAQPQPCRAITEEPPQRCQRRIEMTEDAAPQVGIGYLMPPAGDRDSDALRVAARVLSSGGGSRGGGGGGGGAGRLFKKLVLGKGVALSAFASARAQRYPGLFAVSAAPAPGRSLEELEAALTEEIENLATEPATGEELGRIRNALDADAVRRMTSNFGLAAAIAEAEGLAGDWRYLFTDRERLKAVQAADIQRAAARFLARDRRTVGILRATKEGRARTSIGEEQGR